MDAYIYALRDPRDGRVRYVGKSVNPKARYGKHLREVRSTPKCRWIEELKAEGLKPELVLLHKCKHKDIIACERRWIAKHDDLLNANPGGAGVPAGYKQSPEHVAKRMAHPHPRGFLGKQHAPDSPVRKGHWTGKKLSPEHIAAAVEGRRKAKEARSGSAPARRSTRTSSQRNTAAPAPGSRHAE